MGKYLVLWELDPTKVPVDPKERAAGWSGLLNMVKKDFEKGTMKDYGAILGESRGYTIFEGSDLDIDITLQQYVPYVKFETHPIRSVSDVEEMLRAMSKNRPRRKTKTSSVARGRRG